MIKGWRNDPSWLIYYQQNGLERERAAYRARQMQVQQMQLAAAERTVSAEIADIFGGTRVSHPH